jgi:hypothetical protein
VVAVTTVGAMPPLSLINNVFLKVASVIESARY